MVALSSKRLTFPLAPLVAGVLAAFVALVFALLPADMLGNLVLDSGVAALVPAAEPPLGATARAALILIGGGGIGLVAWFTVFLLIGTRSIAISGGRVAKDHVPVLRRADAHPDAPARRPLFATEDLGTPFLDVRAPLPVTGQDVERDLPANLDLPLSAYDPLAIPAKPIDRPMPLAPLIPAARRQVFNELERFETFDLTPVLRDAQSIAPDPAPLRQPPPPSPLTPTPSLRSEFDPAASIQALLDRLEQGVISRSPAASGAPVSREESLQESLASLRRLATSR